MKFYLLILLGGACIPARINPPTDIFGKSWCGKTSPTGWPQLPNPETKFQKGRLFWLSLFACSEGNLAGGAKSVACPKRKVSWADEESSVEKRGRSSSTGGFSLRRNPETTLRCKFYDFSRLYGHASSGGFVYVDTPTAALIHLPTTQPTWSGSSKATCNQGTGETRAGRCMPVLTGFQFNFYVCSSTADEVEFGPSQPDVCGGW